MISETSLKRMCNAAVLSRARKLADENERIHVRKCRYEGPDTVLGAKVEASYSWDGSYRTSVVIDEEADALVDYDCSCPAARQYSGPCKHAIALVLDFNQRPQEYAGYEAATHVSTSRGIARLIERARDVVPHTQGAGTEENAGTVGIELTLSREVGFDARFRLVGSRGAYVLKSVTDFVADLEAGAYRSYGKNLAFVHEPSSFTEQGREVAAFLVRAIQNRRSYSYQRVMGRGAYSSVGLPGRDLHLSAPELRELVELYVGQTVLFEDLLLSGSSAGVQRLEVVVEDPVVSLALRPGEEGSYELMRDTQVRIAFVDGVTLAWDARMLYLCSRRMARRAELLGGVLDDPADVLTIAQRDVGAFCAVALPRLEEAARVDVPQTLEALRPAPCELRFYIDKTERAATCKAVAVYGSWQVPLVSIPASVKAPQTAQGERASAYDETLDTPADVVRDPAREALGREVVRRYFPVVNGKGFLVCPAKNDSLARLVYEGVPELQRVGTVYTTAGFDRLRLVTRPRVRVGLSVQSNLLDLSLQAQGIPQHELAGLLESYRLKRSYHRLSDGSFVRMADADLSQADEVVQELGLSAEAITAGHASLPAYRVLSLQGTAAGEEVSKSVEDYVAGLHSVDLASYEVPVSLEGVLRPYQVEGHRWLCGLAELGLGGILADEMGLGKTLQLISFLLARREESHKVGPTLIVCPASLVYNWQAEFTKFAPSLAVCVIAGTAEERAVLRAQKTADVLVTSYDLLRRDVEAYAAMDLWCVTLDEAQYIKNHETLVSRAVKMLSAQHRVALTGTPVENRLSELWSIFDFLMPGLLGSYESFRERFERPIVEEDDQRVLKRLRGVVRPFILRRTKLEVAQDLPDKVEEIVHARMGDEQRRLYDAQVQDLRDHIAGVGAEGFGQSKIAVLAALTRLRQTCCDPSLVFEDYYGGSCKTDTIVTLVERARDAEQKVLVFSQFTSYLARIAEALDARGITYFTLTGSTPKRRRLEMVEQFNSDNTPVFLVSLKAGGTGLNLTGATVVIHADPWWNEAAQNQATDRAHRIGQTRDVTVYKVITSDTLEERIAELQRTKAELADAVVAGDSSGVSLASLTKEDLEDLLS